MSVPGCLCVRVPLLARHATRVPYCDVTCGPSGSTIFLDYLTNGTIFGKKSLNIEYVFWFSLQLLFETFLILRINQRDVVINVKTSSGKVPFIFVGF